jgi:hypothetical protein
MAQTLQNQLLLAKSMNGIITFDDGAGTVISDGVVTTENLITDTMTSVNMVSTNMIVPRISPNLVSFLGANINLTTLAQNMYFDETNRFLRFYSDIAVDYFDSMIVLDQNSGSMDFKGEFIGLNCTVDLGLNATNAINISATDAVNFDNSDVIFNNSTLTIPRQSTSSLNTYLGPGINLNVLLQNLSFAQNERTFEIYSDNATFGTLAHFDCSLNYSVFRESNLYKTDFSGSNLNNAEEVIFLDPVYGDKQHRLNTENQAIGRVRRLGNKYDKINVLRILIKDSIEEEIFKANQN